MLDHIKEALEIMRENELAEFELQRENLKLRLQKNDRTRAAEVPPPVPRVPVAFAVNTVPGKSEGVRLHVVKSPVVGTFHRASRPGSTPLVGPGDAVKKGQVLAIVAAIRLTHDITAECGGRILEVSADDGQAVEYGHRLFQIAPE